LALSLGADIVASMNAPGAPKNEGIAANGSAFGRLLRGWRGRRGFSQLDLAFAARTTQRHLSFIESGRATPSRAMILRLAGALNLPLRQQNALMLAAGYAPVWRERDLSTPDLAVVDSALDYMLAQHEPYPAFVVDRCWNLLRANRGAMNLTEFLIGAAPADSPSEPVNMAVALVSGDGLRPFIVNWREVVLYFVRGVQADARADGTAETADLLTRLLAFPDVAALSDTMPLEKESQSPILPIHFFHKAKSLRLFTTIATLGTPRDVTLQEVRIEFFFPMDEPTARTLRGWAEPTRPAARDRVE
jgi:transcriptional regulator with XRE-family HTH domain